LKKFDYVEEEFFVRGVAPIYGPESSRLLQPGENPWNLKPLSSVRQPDAPYQTRIQVIRHQGATRFSGIVHRLYQRGSFVHRHGCIHPIRGAEKWMR
jgi:hypothetical protein